MVARNSPWVSMVLACLCLGIGAGIGITWAGSRAPVWTAAPTLPGGVSLPSFASVVRQVETGVVNVVALREATGDGAATTAPTADDTARSAPVPGPNGGLKSVHDGSAAVRSGSGFVVAAGGLVVTSRHVVLGSFHIDVLVPGRREFAAEIVGEDPATDLALLRLVDAPDDLKALPLAVDPAPLQAGDWIVAVGNPFGYAQTVTAGVVSFVGRHLRHSDFGVTSDFLQISAPVNPGSSGCPVFDLHGHVVGVTTQAPIDAQGISFAVPARTVAWTLDAMQRCPDGRVRRGFLGIEFQSRGEVDTNGKRLPGAVITDVMAGKPAHEAGLRVGDIVVEVDGAAVADAMALHERIVRAPPGSRIAVELLRGGRDGARDRVVAVLGEVGSRDARRAH